MKIKLFTLLAILSLSATSTEAQSPTYTSASQMIIGDSTIIYRIDTVGLSEGPSGAGVTWSFPTLDSIGITKKYAVTPSSTPCASSYPAANLAEKIIYAPGGPADYQFYDAQTSSLDIIGLTGNPVIDSTKYTNPDRAMIYSISYLDGFSDSSAYTTYINLQGSRIITHKSRTTNFDGYGTLVLPTGTYTDVLRYVVDSYRIDSFYTNKAFSSASDWHIQEYFWVSPSYRTYLMYLNPIRMVDGVQQDKAAEYVPDPGPAMITSTSMPTHDHMNISVYPNPTHNELNILLPSQLQNAELIIYNAVGQEENHTANIRGSRIHIETANLQPGLFFFIISEKGKTLAGKFSIE